MNLVLETSRLVLRPYRAEDAPAIESMADNWNVARMLGRMPHPYPKGGALEWMASHDDCRTARTGFPFAITRENIFIGGIGLDRHGGDAFEFGYWLGEPYWKQGFATEAGRAVVRFGFETLSLPCVTAGHFVENEASARVLAKLGFRYIGTAMRDCLARGCKVESRELILDRADWKPS